MKNILLMKYIHLFKTNSEFTTSYNGPDYIEPWLSLTKETMTININKPKLTDFSTEPLTFNILSDGKINWKASNSAFTKTIDYKLNDGEWTSITSNTGSSAPSITVTTGDKIQFKGNNAQYATNSSRYNSFNGSTASFEPEGNIMSLIYGDDFKNNLIINSGYTFFRLFTDCTNFVSAENLILPATTLAPNCYAEMFYNCTSLTTAPKELPATTLAPNCYAEMFNNCTSLTTAPKELPATTLADSCYKNMFYNCRKLTTTPKELPATTLATECYKSMFYKCTSLTEAPELPATTLAKYCYTDMFQYCSNLTTAPKELPATTLADYCYQEMFYACTSLTTAPELPATTLTKYCYTDMFYACTNLNYIKCLATDISANACTTGWVNRVAPKGTFVKNPNMTSWTTGIKGIPTGWAVQDA